MSNYYTYIHGNVILLTTLISLKKKHLIDHFLPGKFLKNRIPKTQFKKVDEFSCCTIDGITKQNLVKLSRKYFAYIVFVS